MTGSQFKEVLIFFALFNNFGSIPSGYNRPCLITLMNLLFRYPFVNQVYLNQGVS